VASVQGVEIRRDGVVLGRPLWGSATPTDPGVHKLTASAPGQKSWAGTVTVPVQAGSASIQIPALEPLPAAHGKPAEAKGDQSGRSDQSDRSASRGKGQRILGATAVGLGIASAVVGGYFGLRVKSKNDSSASHCDSGNVCDQAGFDLRHDALRSATISDVAFVAAGVLIAGGAILFFAAPRASSRAAVGAGSAHVECRGLTCAW
jgi:hypothetical protein